MMKNWKVLPLGLAIAMFSCQEDMEDVNNAGDLTGTQSLATSLLVTEATAESVFEDVDQITDESTDFFFGREIANGRSFNGFTYL